MSDINQFAKQVKDKLGLERFDLDLDRQGNIELVNIEVPRDSRQKGTGAAALKALTDYADRTGALIWLSVADRDSKTGTTSRGRLVKFYRQFGFIPNKGRNKRFELSLYANMYRDPKGLQEEINEERELYSDEDIVASIDIGDNGIVIYTFASRNQGRGGARRGLTRLRKLYGNIEVTDIGSPEDESYQFWKHVLDVGLVDVVHDMYGVAHTSANTMEDPDIDEEINDIRRRAGLPLLEAKSSIKNITPAVINQIKKIAKQVHDNEECDVSDPNQVGFCPIVSEILSNKFGWETMGGVYLSKSLEPIGDHVWNMLSDGTIVDATALQFHEGNDLKIIPSDSPEQKRYRMEWSQDYNPDMSDYYPELKDVKWSGEHDFDATRRLRKERGNKWWLNKKYNEEINDIRRRAGLPIKENYQQYPPVMDADQVFDYVSDIHHTPEDIHEGDIYERIQAYGEYKLVDLPMNDVDHEEWAIDDDMVDEYIEQLKTSPNYPPIVFDTIAKSIIDGTHRANALHQLGAKTIRAYAGIPNTAR